MKLVLGILLLSLVACGGREAKVYDAPNEQITKPSRASYQATLAADQKIDPSIRSVTLLTYPLESDLDKEGYVFERDPEKAHVWKRVEEQVPYLTDLIENFNRYTGRDKVEMLIAAVVDMGRYRNDSYIKMRKVEIEKRQLDKETKDIDAAVTTFTCWSKKRFSRRGENQCKSKEDAEHTRSKTATCKLLPLMKFDDLTEARDKEYNRLVTWCTGSRNDEITARLTELNDDYVKQKRAFDDGESVVLDLLESLEKFTNEVHISTASTKEKEDSLADVKSVLKFNREMTKVEEFVLYLDFGVNFDQRRKGSEDRVSGKTAYRMLSEEELKQLDDKNSEVVRTREEHPGTIQNVKIYTNRDGATMLRFDLVTVDFVIQADLSVGLRTDFGLRLVGDTVVKEFTRRHKVRTESDPIYTGVVRDGVMKIELDVARGNETFLNVFRKRP